MKQIRRGVFETNSSSTHSLTMCMEDDFKRWERGELYLIPYSREKTFITKEEAEQYCRENEIPFTDEELRDSEIYSWDNYCTGDLEYFEEHFTTPAGERVVSFGEYGYDG